MNIENDMTTPYETWYFWLQNRYVIDSLGLVLNKIPNHLKILLFSFTLATLSPFRKL